MAGFMDAFSQMFAPQTPAGLGQMSPLSPAATEQGGLEGMLTDPRMLLALNILSASQGQPGQPAPGFGQVLAQSGLSTAGMLQQITQQRMQNKLAEQDYELKKKYYDILGAREKRAEAREKAVEERAGRAETRLDKTLDINNQRLKLYESMGKERLEILRKQLEAGKEPSDIDKVRYLNMLDDRARAIEKEQERLINQQNIDSAIDAMDMPDEQKLLYKMGTRAGDKSILSDLVKNYQSQQAYNNPATQAVDTMKSIHTQVMDKKGFFTTEMKPEEASEFKQKLEQLKPLLSLDTKALKQYDEVNEVLENVLRARKRPTKEAITRQIYPEVSPRGKVDYSTRK